MRAIRIAGALLLGLALAVSLAACQKSPNQDVSSTTPEQNPATAQESPPPSNVPDANAPVPAQNATPTPPAKAPASSGKTASGKSSGSKSTTAVPAAGTRSVSLPAGTTFDVSLTTPVNTGKSQLGDKIEATLVQDLNAADGTPIAKQGAVVRGEITELKSASHSKAEEDRATVKLNFTSIETVDGEKTLTSTLTNSEGNMTAGGTGKRDALVIGGSAALGAILGKVIGKDTKGAVIGAFGGAILGTGAMMAAKGHEVDVPAGSKITLRADAPVTVVAR